MDGFGKAVGLIGALYVLYWIPGDILRKRRRISLFSQEIMKRGEVSYYLAIIVDAVTGLGFLYVSFFSGGPYLGKNSAILIGYGLFTLGSHISYDESEEASEGYGCGGFVVIRAQKNGD